MRIFIAFFFSNNVSGLRFNQSKWRASNCVFIKESIVRIIRHDYQNDYVHVFCSFHPVIVCCVARLQLYTYPGGPKNGTVDTVDFSGLCSDQQLYFITLLDRASFPHYMNTKIIKFGWELFILWVISYGLSFLGFARFPEFRGTINDKLMANPENNSP